MCCKKIMKALKKMGWEEVKVSSGTDHKKFKNSEGRVTIIPYKGSRQLAPGTINAICKQVGLTKKEFMQYV